MKIRIYELAKELNIQSKELMELLESEFGIITKNHMSVIEEEDSILIKELLAEKQKEEDTKKSVVDEYEEIEVKKTEKVFKPRKSGRNDKGTQVENKIEKSEVNPVEIQVGSTIKVGDLAELLNKTPADVIKTLIFEGIMASINAEIDFETASKVAEKYEVCIIKEEDEFLLDEIEDEEEEVFLEKKAPVVTVMGHVDHGKTSLLDAIRATDVIAGEAGGITQHIGAYTVKEKGEKITFLDTPGHEAFTAMRARGAQITDIVILVVAADDGLKPQTKEAIDHCMAAEVPMIVAINKMDKPDASADKVKQELAEYNVLVEDYGGDVAAVAVSAKKKTGIDSLLDMVILTAEMLELKANPNRPARGTVIEAKLDKGRGPVATVLVQNGTLNNGDSIIVGNTYGRIRAMFDDKGKKTMSALPSVPVEILGLSEVPNAGDRFNVVRDEKTGRNLANMRKLKEKNEGNKNRVSLEDLYSQIKEGKVKELDLIIKADVQGSVEAFKSSLEKLSTEDIRVRVIRGGVGAINESDVILAQASNAIVIGFNVRPDVNSAIIAEKEGIEIKTYNVIYAALEDVKKAMIGLLEPDYKEVVLGRCEIRKVYKISNVGSIAGCYVTNGKIIRNGKIRLIREGIVIFEGELASLKRFKDDVKEANQGYECGLNVEGFNDIKEGDEIESFKIDAIKREKL